MGIAREGEICSKEHSDNASYFSVTEIFSNLTHANYWLAKEGEVEDQGFVVRVGNSKRKIVGVHIRNINTTKTKWATRTFKLEGSLLKEPERITQRGKENTAQWTPEILKAEGEWDDLLNVTLEDNQTLQSFFFDGTTELRYLWFHLLSFYGKGGGLHYFAPILQSGECHTFSSPYFQTHQTCACGPTGQAATGSATRKIQETRREDCRRRKLNFHKKLLTFAMKVRCSAVTKIAQVNLWSGFSLYSI